jgi:drug/metabolite transporter (DMT)-like permease
VALSAGAAVAYGTGPVMIKAALQSGVAVWTLMIHRLLIAAVLLWALVITSRALAGLAPGASRYALPALAVGALIYSAQLACFALALERISASLVVILFHTFPIVVTVVAVVLGRDRLVARSLTALTLGVGGVALVALAGDELRAEPLGILLGLGSAAACAGVVLGSDVLSDRLPPLALAALLIGGAALAFVATLPLVGFDPAVEPPTWLLIVAIAVVPGVLGTTAMLAGVRAIGPSLASILMALEPPVAVVLAWIVFGETLNAGQMAGAVVILVAAYLARSVAQPLEAEIEVRS